MKLIKHPEQLKLSQYFQKIESIAERKGINVDDLLLDTGMNNFSNQEFSKNVFKIHKNVLIDFSKK